MGKTYIPQGWKALQFIAGQRVEARKIIFEAEKPDFCQTVYSRPENILIVDEKILALLKEKGINFTEL